MNRAKVLAPVRTGRLRASIRVESRSILGLRSKYTIGSDVEYAAFVNDGTRRHVITSKPGGPPLTFMWHGRLVHVRKVTIPAQPARPFLDKALREVASGRGYRFRLD